MRKRKGNSKTVSLAKSEINSTESTIYKELIENEISHEELTIIVNEAENYLSYQTKRKHKNDESKRSSMVAIDKLKKDG